MSATDFRRWNASSYTLYFNVCIFSNLKWDKTDKFNLTYVFSQMYFVFLEFVFGSLNKSWEREEK